LDRRLERLDWACFRPQIQQKVQNVEVVRTEHIHMSSPQVLASELGTVEIDIAMYRALTQLGKKVAVDLTCCCRTVIAFREQKRYVVVVL
jgi:hypothetical protein